MNLRLAFAVVVALLSMAVAGCGGGSEEQSAPAQTAEPESAVSVFEEVSSQREAEARARSAKLLAAADALEENFKPPKTAGLSPERAAELQAAREVCRGLTPLQVRGRYLREANAQGFAGTPEGAIASKRENLRYTPDDTGSYPPGVFASGIYRASLPGETTAASNEGCVYELAREQMRRLRQAARQTNPR